MKKWIILLGIMTAAGIFSRMPHPARDIAKLEPVQTLYLYMEEGLLHMEADTGAAGAGHTLREAAEAMKSNAGAEIFLETAEYVILAPGVQVNEAYFTILHPSCRVCFAPERPDLAKAADYLSVHMPDNTLAHLRSR